MADYIPVIDSSVDPDAPLTSDLMYRLRDNPIAISEGAINAPKVRSEAMALRTAAADRTSDGVFFTLTGIDRISTFMVNSHISLTYGAAGSASTQYRTSTNGGSTWSGYTAIDTSLLTSGGNNRSTKFDFITTSASVNAIQFGLTSTSGSSVTASLSVLGVRGIAP